jgi:acyl carrier protein
MSTDDQVRPAVLEIVADLTGEAESELVTQPVLAAHKWDSMTSLEALVRMESTFGVELDLRTFNAARTVDDLVALVTA